MYFFSVGLWRNWWVPILPPQEGYRDYINRKCWASLILQAVVDDKGWFRNIFVGIPGSTHDAAVLRQSSLYNDPALHPQASLTIEGVDIPPYPLLPWLMKAYPGPHLTPAEEVFNKHLNSIRVAVEHSFGRLKGRWRVLAKRSDIHHSFIPTVISACCVLHNICEMASQHNRLENECPGDIGLPAAPDNQPPGRPCEEVPTAEAFVVRSTLLQHLQNKLRLWQYLALFCSALVYSDVPVFFVPVSGEVLVSCMGLWSCECWGG